MSQAQDPNNTATPNESKPISPPAEDHTAPDAPQGKPSEPNTPESPMPGAGMGSLAFTALIGLVFGLGGSYVYNRFLAESPKSVVNRPVAAPSVSTAASDTPDSGGSDPAVSTRELAMRFDAMKGHLERLQTRVEALSKSTTPPEVAALQVRIGDLTDSTNSLSSLPSKVDHLENRVSELSTSLRTLREEVATLRPDSDKATVLASSPTNVTVTEAPKTPTPLPNIRHDPSAADGLARGADLFRKGRYQEARDVFSKLELSDPDDARVWYYSALSSGFATKDWTNTAARLVQEGIKHEQAGKPSTSRIDAEFKDLTTATGKDWLAAYRKRVDLKK